MFLFPIDNGAFNFEAGPEVSPERLHADLEAQNRYRQDASPLGLRKGNETHSRGGQPPEPTIMRNSLDMNHEPAQRATYLELQGEPSNQVNTTVSLFLRFFIILKCLHRDHP